MLTAAAAVLAALLAGAATAADVPDLGRLACAPGDTYYPTGRIVRVGARSIHLCSGTYSAPAE